MLATDHPMAFIPTIDAEKARKFYVETIGLHFVSEDTFALVVRSGNIDVRIVRMGSFSPAPYTIFGWKVPDIHAAVSDLSQLGICFEQYPFLQQNSSGIWAAPDGAGQVAWFKDPDGNILSISQHA